MSSPTELIAGRAGKIFNIIDDNGREFKIRRIDALDRLRLLKAAGPELARNDAWLNMAALAFAVVEIERTPRISPATERQIETIVSDQNCSRILTHLQQKYFDRYAMIVFHHPVQVIRTHHFL